MEYRYDAIENMPPPLRKVPDYEALADKFSAYVFDPKSGIEHKDEAGNAFFAAFSEGKSREMVTWGLIAVGEALRPTGKWGDKGKTFDVFYNPNTRVYTNTPGGIRTEYWYMLYVHTLAGAIYRTHFADCGRYKERMLTVAHSIREMARGINYDFNDQGFNFELNKPWTNKDIYRQPDSIGGYAYNMLFAGIHGKDDSLIKEAVDALNRYAAFTENPWYEIPNGSTAVLAAAWLKKQGYNVDLKKILGFVFDPEKGPLQVGNWNGEPVDGLMMGWRGNDRASAASSAYSMETLMPLPVLLPAVRYAPEIAKSVAWYALQAAANFDLFNARGLRGPIPETRPDLSAAIPYERLVRERDGRSPLACGDFEGHRSVYGGGYIPWIAAIMRPTGVEHMPAWDISLTDWLTESSNPEFLLYNRSNEEKTAKFTPAAVWKEKRPDITGEEICVTVPAGEVKMIKLYEW